MNIGKIIVKSDFEGETVFNEKFLKMNRIEQLDLLQDLIGDLSAMHQYILENGDARAQDFIDECAEEENQHFTIQRQLYSEDYYG